MPPSDMEHIKAAELFGPDRFKLTVLLMRKRSLQKDTCVWGKGGILTTDDRCHNPSCAKQADGRTRKHIDHGKMTPKERWALFVEAGVTHFRGKGVTADDEPKRKRK